MAKFLKTEAIIDKQQKKKAKQSKNKSDIQQKGVKSVFYRETLTQSKKMVKFLETEAIIDKKHKIQSNIQQKGGQHKVTYRKS